MGIRDVRQEGPSTQVSQVVYVEAEFWAWRGDGRGSILVLRRCLPLGLDSGDRGGQAGSGCGSHDGMSLPVVPTPGQEPVEHRPYQIHQEGGQGLSRPVAALTAFRPVRLLHLLCRSLPPSSSFLPRRRFLPPPSVAVTTLKLSNCHRRVITIPSRLLYCPIGIYSIPMFLLTSPVVYPPRPPSAPSSNFTSSLPYHSTHLSQPLFSTASQLICCSLLFSALSTSSILPDFQH